MYTQWGKYCVNKDSPICTTGICCANLLSFHILDPFDSLSLRINHQRPPKGHINRSVKLLLYFCLSMSVYVCLCLSISVCMNQIHHICILVIWWESVSVACSSNSTAYWVGSAKIPSEFHETSTKSVLTQNEFSPNFEFKHFIQSMRITVSKNYLSDLQFYLHKRHIEKDISTSKDLKMKSPLVDK